MTTCLTNYTNYNPTTHHWNCINLCILLINWTWIQELSFYGWYNESIHKVFIQINCIIFSCTWFFFHAISFMDSCDLIISYHAKFEDMLVSFPFWHLGTPCKLHLVRLLLLCRLMILHFFWHDYDIYNSNINNFRRHINMSI